MKTKHMQHCPLRRGRGASKGAGRILERKGGRSGKHKGGQGRVATLMGGEGSERHRVTFELSWYDVVCLHTKYTLRVLSVSCQGIC